MQRTPADPDRQTAILLATLEHIDEGISVVGPDLAVIGYNRRFLDLLDFPADLAEGWRNFADFIRYNAERGEYGPGDVEALVLARVEQARNFVPHQLRRTRPNGKVLEIRGSPIPSGGFVTTYRDVTAEEYAHDRLRRERDLRQTLVDSLPGIFYLFNADGRFLWWNKSFEEITGYAGDEIATLHPLDLFEGDESDYVAETIGQVFASGRADIEATLVTKNGRHIHYYFNGVRIEHEGAPALIGVGIDITERKTAEDLVRALNTTLEARVRSRTSELEMRNRELEAFSYSVAHDLRGPLRAIDGFAHLLAEDGGDSLNDACRNHLGRIRGATQRLGLLIDDILDLARVSRQDLRIEAVDLSARVVALSQELAEHDPERRVEWHIAPHIVVRADPVLLDLVIDNLVRNAWKFTAEQTVAEISVTARDIGQTIELCIADNGAGFDMTYADKLFKPFQRLHDSSRFPGTGIGLAIAARVIQRHGGRIWADSPPTGGANFFVSLPK
jgi:PAS domain S-box-containing protein